jgi:hypothetical protein
MCGRLAVLLGRVRARERGLSYYIGGLVPDPLLFPFAVPFITICNEIAPLSHCHEDIVVYNILTHTHHQYHNPSPSTMSSSRSSSTSSSSSYTSRSSSPHTRSSSNGRRIKVVYVDSDGESESEYETSYAKMPKIRTNSLRFLSWAAGRPANAVALKKKTRDWPDDRSYKSSNSYSTYRSGSSTYAYGDEERLFWVTGEDDRGKHHHSSRSRSSSGGSSSSGSRRSSSRRHTTTTYVAGPGPGQARPPPMHGNPMPHPPPQMAAAPAPVPAPAARPAAVFKNVNVSGPPRQAKQAGFAATRTVPMYG